MALAHEKVGHTEQGLWHHKGMQLPAFVQHIARDLMAERGMDESRAIATAIALIKRWAAGGKDVKPETRAKAVAALAEWEALKAKAGASKGSGRMTDTIEQVTFEPKVSYRVAPLEDIQVRSTGDGRTVEAYAAVFDASAEIHDQDGDYMEILDRTAFNRAITDAQPSGTRSRWSIRVLYNHGMNLHGGPSERYSVPIGTPLEVRADGRGLYTVTRYHKTPLAEEILEAIREGSIDGYSFSGQFRRTDPIGPRPFRRNRSGELPVVRRLESTLREFGPTPFQAYKPAAITGVRNVEQLAAEITAMPYEERIRLASLFTAEPLSERSVADAPEEESGLVAEDSRPHGGEMRSGRPPREELIAQRAAFLIRHGGGIGG